MAEYSTNYTQTTTDKTFGTEVYKFSRTVDVINPSAIDNSCIYCGAENGSKYDYYPTYNLGTTEKALMDSKWAAAGGNFIFRNSAIDTPYNITFVKCGETGSTGERGRNTVYQIGKTIYNKASSATNSSMRVLNPIDIRKLIFHPQFSGYTADPSSSMTGVDLKYLMDHPDDFFVQQMEMNVFAWNGSTFTNDVDIQSIRPCIVGEDYFIPVINVLGRHIFDMTDYHSRRDYTQPFYGTYDQDNMPMSFVPILTDETLTYDPEGSLGGGATQNNNKWRWTYNYYNSTYELTAPAREVLKLMAYCGCYMMDSSYNTSGKNLTNFWNNDHIYLGEMKAGARTTGNFIKGTELLTSDTINKGEFSSQTAFNPSGGGGLISDGQSTGGAYSSGGFVKMYACKKSELKDLQEWMSGGPAGPGGTDPTTVPDNFNPIDQFIGLTGFPIEIPTGTYDSTQFIFRAADNTPVNTGINTKTTLTGTQKYMTKSLKIPTWEKDDNAVPWMDYSATVECYVPFCGVVGLDPQVVIGHNVRIQMWVDFISGDCSAYVECQTDGEWHPVAYVSGNLGCAEAMTAAAYGQLMGARAAGAHQMTQAVIGGVKNAVTGTVNSAVSNYARAYGNNNLPVPAGQSPGLARAIASATGTISGGAYGAAALVTNAVNLGVSLTQQNLDNRYNYTVAKNSLGTTIAGSFGSQSSWHYPIMPYVKVTWPTPMSKDVTIYGKTFGVPVHRTGNLKDYHGYTICNNVDTSGISTATAEEQSMIKQYLESGVYLP